MSIEFKKLYEKSLNAIKKSKLTDLSLNKKNKKIIKDDLYDYYTYFFADYLNYKYPNVCAVNNSRISWNNSLYIDNGLYKIDMKKPSTAKSKFIKLIRDCKKRFVLIKIDVVCLQSTILIIDKQLNEVELFDVYHEQDINYYELFIKDIKSLMMEALGIHKFYKPVDFMKKTNFFGNMQIKFCGGFTNFEDYTLAWLLWYAENRIQSPDISRNKLVKALTKLFKKDVEKISVSDIFHGATPLLCKVIENYTNFLLKLEENTSFLKKNVIYYYINRNVYYHKALLNGSILAGFLLYFKLK